MILIVLIAVPMIGVAQDTTKVYQVDDSKCIGCMICVRKAKCPVSAIEMENGRAVIDASKCIGCGLCAQQCPVSAIEGIEITDTTTIEEVVEVEIEISDTIPVPDNGYHVSENACIGCTLCVGKCPVGAIGMVDGKAVIDQDRCIQCGICAKQCPVQAITDENNEEK